MIAISILGSIVAIPNVFAVCTYSSKGAMLCAGSEFNASMDKSNYENTELPVILISGPPDKNLSLKILDSSSEQKFSDTIKIGQNGNTRYSFYVTSYSIGQYHAELSDGISTIDLKFAVSSKGQATVSSSVQSTDKATLRVFSDTSWKGTVGTEGNLTMLSSSVADSSFSFYCKYNDTYSIALQSASNAGRGRAVAVWMVANLNEDGKMLNIGVNRLANGLIAMSGQCHVSQFPMSNTGMVSFTTDKTIYQYGEPIEISGIILPELQRNYNLKSTILNSDGMTIRTDGTNFGGQNTFNFHIYAKGGLWKPGNYRILVEIAKSVAQTDIVINPVQDKSRPIQSGNHIPVWIKNTARYWAEGKISDSEFSQAIQYLIQNRVLKIPYFYSINLNSQSIIGWIKGGASMWANGKMSDDEFVNVIKYFNFKE